jgi:hypothetical protein
LRRDAYITPQQLSNKQLKALFVAIDVSGDGDVSIDEFVAWMNDEVSATARAVPWRVRLLDRSWLSLVFEDWCVLYVFADGNCSH